MIASIPSALLVDTIQVERDSIVQADDGTERVVRTVIATLQGRLSSVSKRAESIEKAEDVVGRSVVYINGEADIREGDWLVINGEKYEVLEVRKSKGFFYHHLEVEVRVERWR